MSSLKFPGTLFRLCAREASLCGIGTAWKLVCTGMKFEKMQVQKSAIVRQSAKSSAVGGYSCSVALKSPAVSSSIAVPGRLFQSMIVHGKYENLNTYLFGA